MDVDKNWQHFIGGSFRHGDERRPVLDPATGEACAEAPEGNAADVNDMVNADRDEL